MKTCSEPNSCPTSDTVAHVDAVFGRCPAFTCSAVSCNAQALGHKPVYATVVQTANWGPDNSYFYGDVETNLLNSDSVIARVALTCHGS